MAPREKKAIRKLKIAWANPIETIANIGSTNEGHPILLAISSTTVKRHTRASLGLELERSKIQEADIDRLRSMYSILDDFKLTFPQLDDIVVFPSPRCIAFYDDVFNTGMRFPLHPFIINILDFYTLTPT